MTNGANMLAYEAGLFQTCIESMCLLSRVAVTRFNHQVELELSQGLPPTPEQTNLVTHLQTEWTLHQ